jgi:hypothetical protein
VKVHFSKLLKVNDGYYRAGIQSFCPLHAKLMKFGPLNFKSHSHQEFSGPAQKKLFPKKYKAEVLLLFKNLQ